jgi:shikimate dehydrogenase
MTNRRENLEKFLDNKLPDALDQARLFAGSAGESPSRYSRSPGMWNAAFREVGLDAAYVPFDVSSENLAAFIATVREQPGFIGGNVTVPHKLAIMDLLDEIDPMAKQIGAVNTYTRNEDGRLVGYNSDADGLLGSMLRTLPGKPEPFLESLAGKRALLLGAGGAGRAAAFAIASKLEGGALAITNRTSAKAEELAGQVAKAYGGVSAVGQEDAIALLPSVDLVVNASSVGQSGLRHLAGGRVTCLEPFSSLAPADPFVATEMASETTFYRQWYEASLPAIEANQAAAARAILTCKPGTAFVDAVYSPDETVMLRQARLAGFKTLNGKGMLIMQAAESFIKRMTRPHLVKAGYDPDTLYDRVVSTMAAAF